MNQPASGSSPRDRTPRSVAGIAIPDSEMAQSAEQLSRDVSPWFLYAHSARAYFFASLVGREAGERIDEEAVYVGCVLHDVGLTPTYEHPSRPFERVSADVAGDLADSFEWEQARKDLLRRSIILHMAAEVEASESPEARMLEAGVAFDVTGMGATEIDEQSQIDVFRHFPRGPFKREFSALLSQEAERKPGCAAATLAGLGLIEWIGAAPFPDTPDP